MFLKNVLEECMSHLSSSEQTGHVRHSFRRDLDAAGQAEDVDVRAFCFCFVARSHRAAQEHGVPLLTPADLALAVQIRPMLLGPLLLPTREKIAAACVHAVPPSEAP